MREVLLDSTPLVLFIVGNLDPSRLGGRRLEAFDRDTLKYLNDEVARFPRHVSVPNVLTEASNHIGSGSQQLARGAADALGAYIERVVDEVYKPSLEVVARDCYRNVGLADAAILECLRHGMTVITTDHELYARVHEKGGSAINLFHRMTPRR